MIFVSWKFLIFSFLSFVYCSSAIAAKEAPALILQITVDQLRADMLNKYYGRFGEGGFKYLLDTGVVYSAANHNHANSETIVGHTTLSTGATPSVHGMVANVWQDKATQTLRYNVEDANYPILGADAGVDKKREIDPTQKSARSDGRSPNNIRVSTFSDELIQFTAGQGKSFGVSVKDRGAIAMAGHSGKAFWFSKKSGQFITSSYYYEKYPKWVQDWNGTDKVKAYGNSNWSLSYDKSSYIYGDQDDREFETALGGFGRVFPHPYGKSDGKYYTTFLTISPAGDQLVVDFAKTLFVNEDLGGRGVTDYLSVSLSSTDYVGHIFGPSSLEAEDNILKLDKTLAEFLKFVDEQVGLDKTLIVLSSDHGAPEAPGALTDLGFSADYIHPEKFDKASAIVRLKEKFEIEESLISTYFHPYIYLNRDVITANNLDLQTVQEAVAEELSRLHGVHRAIPSTHIEKGMMGNSEVHRLVENNHDPSRSGDIYVVFEPNRFINKFGKLTVASTHGSPWRYDTHVPLVFAGMGIKPRYIPRLVYTTAVAPTLTSIIGTKLPSGAFDAPLEEVLLQLSIAP